MTATEPLPPDTWNQEIANLKARYKTASPAILTALNILLHDQNISVEDAKAQANLRGTKITTASISAAKVLLSRMDALPPLSPAASASSAPSRPRRPRATDAPADAEALVRNFVAKLQNQGNAEADRLRDAIRRAIAVLQAAAG